MSYQAALCPVCSQLTTEAKFRPFCSAECSNADLDRVCAELVADLEQVAEELLGPRNKAASTQATWRWGSKGGLKLEVRGRKRGVWQAKDSLQGGGIIGLIALANSCSKAQAIKWARARTGGPASGFDYGADQATRQAERDRKAREDAAAEAKEAAGRIGYARRMWGQSVPIAGTPAEAYLVETRGIPASAWPDSAVRFHVPTNALIVAATLVGGSVSAVQRIFLTPAGTKVGPEELAARRLPAVKTTNGPLAGAVVRLPAQKSSQVENSTPHDTLVLAEGPETSLSLWAATGHEVWCALGSIANVEPPGARPIIVGSDDNPRASDEKHGAAARALADAMARWTGEGRTFTVAYPWPVRQHDSSDFNDVIKAGGVAAVRARIDTASPPEPPPPKRLPAYYPAATEPRDAALARQRSIIAEVVRDGAERTAIRQEVRRRRDEEADRLEYGRGRGSQPAKAGRPDPALHARGAARTRLVANAES